MSANTASQMRFASKRDGSKAWTLTEILVAVGVFVVFFVALMMLWTRSRKFEDTLTSHATAQYEARRAFLRLLQEIQEGVAMVLPADGFTQPYLVIRDREDRVVVYYLVEDKKASEREKVPIYSLVKSMGDYPASGSAATKSSCLQDISCLTFTGIGSGGVIVNLTIRISGKDYSLVSMVRLKALSALESL